MSSEQKTLLLVILTVCAAIVACFSIMYRPDALIADCVKWASFKDGAQAACYDIGKKP